ncbi:peptide chain release factor family protein [Pontiella sulfatireligans]|uniref:Peptide chain release factor 2 n=1 Tax=Pontiella sulfatireligans TaxID=2750658 RepID=A0A6C2URE2_9BACT|nr:peptide chain release factor-like protein [Pontiella sulfatireligans]VGO21797.1 Peptide chain release factor 2 [Pontiella sulfatireligans]
MITSEKMEKLQKRMVELGILEQEIEEHFIRGSGSGGQKVNKTSSCVQLVHPSSGIEVRCQHTRSQADNRYWARRELCEKIEEKVLGEKSAKQQAAEKIRRQKRRRSRRAKAKMLDAKTKQGSKKKLRGRVRPDD